MATALIEMVGSVSQQALAGPPLLTYGSSRR